jgi:hypothetical protein
MSTHLGLKSKGIAVALALILGLTGSTWAAPPADGSRADANGATGAPQPAATAAVSANAPAPAATATTSSANAAAKPAEAASSSMESELQELRVLLEAQAQQLQQQSQELQDQHQKMLELEAALTAATPGFPLETILPPPPWWPNARTQRWPVTATFGGTEPGPKDRHTGARSKHLWTVFFCR